MTDEAALATRLGAIVGDAHVDDDPATRDLRSEDIFTPARHRVALVVAPRSVAEVSAVVAAAIGAGFAVAPRGAGMSYTGGYLPADDRTVSLDLRRLDRVIRVDPDDMTVTVEAGCTWATLNQAVAKHGLRTPFWGAMSGLKSTVGGGLSYLNAMFGAGRYGTTSESVVAVTVVLADGRILRTGARGAGGERPFYRHYGPDLTGLFCGDSGAFGVKAEITLRLMRAPAHQDHLSFSFPTGAQLIGALAAVAREGLASETCGFDPALTRARLKRASLAGDVKALGAVVASGTSVGKGLVAAARVALGGRDFVPDDGWPLHLIAEGRSAAAVAHDVVGMRAIAKRYGGVEIENTIARMIRAMPFPPLNSVVGPDGEAWVPVHGQCPLSTAPAILAAIETLFARHKDEADRLGVWTAYLFSSVSTNALTIEPVFYWPEGWRPIHAQAAEATHLARLTRPADSAAARALVERLRHEVIAIFAAAGVAHFQIGRTYPYRDSRDEASKALLDAIKAFADPGHALNPGALGFMPA